MQTTDATPGGGADFAITAQLKGGAVLQMQASSLLPKTDEPVQLSTRLELAGQSLTIRDARAQIRYPDGIYRNVELAATGAEWRSSWTPSAPGLYGIDVTVNGNAPDGTLIERSAFLSVEAQPKPEQFQPIQLALAAAVGIIVVLFAIWILLKLRRKIRQAKVG